ncbi:MAG: accessory factor UbiK family protein [Luminiphilus sp.]|nr:accessory factor UbiK family protein [Luminiphilus sp.]
MPDQDKGQPGSGGNNSGIGGGPGELFERLLGPDNPVLNQLDKNAKALAQSALAKLDVVSRAEFDAQAAVLQRTRSRVEALEAELLKLTEQLEAIEQDRGAD